MNDIDTLTPLTPLDPSFVPARRSAHAIAALLPLVVAGSLELAKWMPQGTVIGPVAVLLAYWVWVVPQRRYRRWGYDVGADRLRIVHGYVFHTDTVVPFGRIQHLDVNQGPIERQFGLATLCAHTAGTHGSTITLPGLPHADALMLRDSIRDHIKRAHG